MRNETFKGYERDNGVGIRNHILIIPTVACSGITVKRIVESTKNYYHYDDGAIKALYNPYGCGQSGEDLVQTERTITNLGKNPNVNSVLVISLGCEAIDYEKLADRISENKTVAHLNIQNYGGKDTIEKGIKKVKELTEDAVKSKRKDTPIEHLSIGLECGGSDYTSGLASNPLVGTISDWIVNNGGTTVISEIPEFIGSEHIYANRSLDKRVGREIIQTVNNMENKLSHGSKTGLRGGQPSPGNMDGGITTLEEKSLGAVKKSGSAPVTGVLDYSEIPSSNGHFMMIGPGYDIESVSGLVSSGCNLVLFTTGRGTPAGNIVSPVIKITANKNTYELMDDFIDFNCSKILDGEETIDNSADRLKEHILSIANGRKTLSELNDQDDFAIYRIGPTY